MVMCPLQRKMPRSSQDAMREMAEEKIRAFFDQHGLDFGISAEILLMHEISSNPDEALPMIKKAFLPQETLVTS